MKFLLVPTVTIIWFYVLGYLDGSFKSLTELLNNTSPIDHLVPVISCIVTSTIAIVIAGLSPKEIGLMFVASRKRIIAATILSCAATVPIYQWLVWITSIT